MNNSRDSRRHRRRLARREEGAYREYSTDVQPASKPELPRLTAFDPHKTPSPSLWTKGRSTRRSVQQRNNASGDEDQRSA